MGKKWYLKSNLPKITIQWRRESVFTPFFRRFRNEREHETKELQKLFARVTEMHAESAISVPEIALAIMGAVDAHPSLFDEIWTCLTGLLSHCDELYPPIEPDWGTLSIEIASETKNQLYTQEAFLKKRLLHVVIDAITASLRATHLEQGSGLFTAPLYTFDTDMVQNVMRPFYTDAVLDNYLFTTLRGQIRANIEEEEPKSYTIDFLNGTPFQELLRAPTPLSVPDEIFFSHMHVVGGSGVGKTQFLGQLILNHLETDATIIVVDSQSSLIPQLRTLKKIQDRLVYIDPRNPPTIDLFKSATIETFDYLFSGIVGADLTAKQGIFFRYVARLLMSIEGSNHIKGTSTNYQTCKNLSLKTTSRARRLHRPRSRCDTDCTASWRTRHCTIFLSEPVKSST
jgi:hypothetical protein